MYAPGPQPTYIYTHSLHDALPISQPIERVLQLVSLIRRRFPGSEVRFVDTVCQPTKQRQTAAIEMAQQSDVVIVIGGDRKSTRLNSSHMSISYAVFCLKKQNNLLR